MSKVTYERELLEMEFFPVQTMRTPDGLKKSMAKNGGIGCARPEDVFCPILVGREAWDLVLPVD